MSLASTLARGRRAAESRMTSRCRIRRPDPQNPTVVDGIESPGWADVYADLPLRLTGGEGFRTVTVGETQTQVAVREAHVPADTTGLKDGDLIEVTAGENVGAVLRVVEASWQDQATARRLPVVEERRPEEWDA